MYTKPRRQNEITNYAKYMKNSESENYDKKSDKTQQRAIQQLNYAKQINIYPIKMRFVISLQLIHMRLGPNDMRHLVCVCVAFVIVMSLCVCVRYLIIRVFCPF